MRIRVDEIPDAGRSLHFHWDENRLRERMPRDEPETLRLIRPVNVDLDITKRPDHIHIQGSIHTVVEQTCHRCLRAFPRVLEETVNTFLVREPSASDEEEVELESQDLDYEFFDGEIIEIDDLVMEHIFLSLPVQILCSDKCRGLCAHCGANLNEAPCRCEEKEKDSPFAVLESIRTTLPDRTNT